MLNNTVPILTTDVSIVSSGTPLSLSLVDVDNGRSVRKFVQGGVEYVLTVSNLDTKENAPVGSRRVQVRLEVRKVLSDGAVRVAFASMVISSPKSSDFSDSENLGLVRALIHFLSGGEGGSTTAHPFNNDWDGALDQGPAFVSRLLTGEV